MAATHLVAIYTYRRELSTGAVHLETHLHDVQRLPRIEEIEATVSAILMSATRWAVGIVSSQCIRHTETSSNEYM